jgi:hypothetical protein
MLAGDLLEELTDGFVGPGSICPLGIVDENLSDILVADLASATRDCQLPSPGHPCSQLLGVHSPISA